MTISTTSTTSTTIIIPGRETQVINGLTLSKADVVASFAGDIDLGQMVATETKDGGNVTIAFANRTGTKGSNGVTINIDSLNIQADGDIVVNTRIEIPGREAQVIPGIVMAQADVRAAFAGEIDLGGMVCNECADGDTQVISFANRTGTKGQVDLLDLIFKAVQAQAAQNVAAPAPAAPSNTYAVMQDEDEDEFEEDDLSDEYDVQLLNTRIVIPGREAQIIQGIVLDAQMVKDSFSGEIDLSGYNVEEVDNGDTLDVIFTARTGTKG